MEWFLGSRVARDAKPTDVYLKASIRRHELERAQAAAAATAGGIGSVNWTPIGPSVIQSQLPGGVSGRITSLAVGPSGNRVYAGAANGGVWFSSDAGKTWTPLNDYIVSPTLFTGFKADSLSVGALAVRFGGSAGADEVFVGTGEANGADSYAGIGVRHLVAAAWSLEATNLAGRGIFAVVIDPDDPAPPTSVSHVYAATTAGLFKRPTAGSVASWTQVTSPSFTNGNGWVSDFIAAGKGASKMFYAAFNGDGVYGSPDGVTWTAITGITPTAGRRIALAASESSPGAVYALLSDASLYRLSGNTFYPVPGLPQAALFMGNQGLYDIAIAVSPSDPNTILVGGDVWKVFRGTITGTPGSFAFPFANPSQPWLDPTYVSQGVHPDVHAIAFGLNAAGTAHDPNIVWVGTDGGAYQSLTGAAANSFKPCNLGLAITELNSVAQRSDTPAVVFAGAQDNGAPRLLSEQAALDTEGGDAGGAAFDPGNPYRVMLQYYRAYLWVTADGGATWSGANFPPATTAGQQENSATEWVAPLKATASGGTSLVAFGTNRLWLSTDWGSSWVTLPTATDPYVAMPPDMNQDVIDGLSIRAIALASPARIYAATFNTVWRYDFAVGSWSKTVLPTTGLPAIRTITSLAADLDPTAAPGSLYATFGLAGSAHCYYFNGTSWLPAMPASVVDVPSHAVVVDPVTPSKVYVGTDVGCFQGTKSGPAAWSWVLFSQGLPEAAITDLEIFAAAPPARLLRAATYGRGVWEIDLSATMGLDPELYLRVNYADDGRLSAAGSRYPWVEGSADPTHVGYTLYHWMSADIKVRRSSLTGLPSLTSPVSYLDYAANIGDYVDTTWQAETADLTGTDRIFVEVHNRSLNPVNSQQVSVLLLQADASAALPNLPVDWKVHVNAADVSSAWLAGSGWAFVDPMIPYRTPHADLDVRTPQVVEYQSTFGSFNLPLGHDHVCLAAFVTAPGDTIASALVDLNQVTMTDRHVAHRNIHLVGAGLKPILINGKRGRQPQPETFVIDFHNPTKDDARFDLVFDRRHFPGHLSVILPKLRELANPDRSLQGFRIQKRRALDLSVRDALDNWLDHTGRRLEELEAYRDGEPMTQEWVNRRIRGFSSLDPARVLVADDGAAASSINRIKIRARRQITAAITIQAPEHSHPGDRFRLDVLQRSGAALVGGSTYVIVVTGERERSSD